MRLKAVNARRLPDRPSDLSTTGGETPRSQGFPMPGVDYSIAPPIKKDLFLEIKGGSLFAGKFRAG
jgi:hypothetical protein